MGTYVDTVKVYKHHYNFMCRSPVEFERWIKILEANNIDYSMAVYPMHYEVHFECSNKELPFDFAYILSHWDSDGEIEDGIPYTVKGVQVW